MTQLLPDPVVRPPSPGRAWAPRPASPSRAGRLAATAAVAGGAGTAVALLWRRVRR